MIFLENRMRKYLLWSIFLLAISVASSAMSSELGWSKKQQMLRVLTADWNASSGELQRFERRRSGWRAVGAPIAVSIGRNGSAWGLGLHPNQPGVQKREGDGRAPAGVFTLGTAFGYAPSLSSKLGYTAMQAEHYCVDVPGSAHYNRIVDTRLVGDAAIEGSTEPMRRDVHLAGDQLYRMGFVIEHNAAHQANAGSCIFAHLWRAPTAPTAGCTAMDEASMQLLLDWLDRNRQPRLVLMPRADYAERIASWGLPAL
jgi:L,D-peptidoglycan transpeptidase YkuD (ErfK/YbiS/YcfS/YnhG family)